VIPTGDLGPLVTEKALEARRCPSCLNKMAEAHSRRIKNSSADPSYSAGPSTGRRAKEQQSKQRKRVKKDGRPILVPVIVSSNGHVDREPTARAVTDEEPVWVLSNTSPPPSSLLTRRPISLDSSSGDELNSNNMRELRRPDDSSSREEGAVVDLTNDSGVEDEDVVDLTSPIQVSTHLI